MRRGICVALLLAWIACGTVLSGQSLHVRVEGERMRISGPQFHFLAGHALDRLHNGATVTFALQLTARSEHAGQILSSALQKFTFSYDLWEERFSVTRLGSPTRSVSNLSAARAEEWCLDNLSLPVTELPNDRPFWVALAYETEEPSEAPRNDDSWRSLSGLIDIFSRRPKDEQHVRGVDEVGPFRLADLRKKQVQ